MTRKGVIQRATSGSERSAEMIALELSERGRLFCHISNSLALAIAGEAWVPFEKVSGQVLDVLRECNPSQPGSFQSLTEV